MTPPIVFKHYKKLPYYEHHVTLDHCTNCIDLDNAWRWRTCDCGQLQFRYDCLSNSVLVEYRSGRFACADRVRCDHELILAPGEMADLSPDSWPQHCGKKMRLVKG